MERKLGIFVVGIWNRSALRWEKLGVTFSGVAEDVVCGVDGDELDVLSLKCSCNAFTD
jgi:hypothetical protein